MRSLFRLPHRRRDGADILPKVDQAALRQQVIDGVPACIGEPDVDLEGVAQLSCFTREGFALLSGAFPSQSPGALRTLLQQRQPPGGGQAGDTGKQLYSVSTAVQDLAASDLFRNRLAAAYNGSDVLPPTQLPSVAQYLSRLAAAAAADATFVLPGTAPKQTAGNADTPSHGVRDASGSSISSGLTNSAVGRHEDGGICELCGDPTPQHSLAACSRGHAICTLCLRQYICYTHGLQAGLDSLKCLAFAADSLGPDDAFSVTEHRCPGTYAHSHLAAALRPTELLQIGLADVRREARVAAMRAVPFGCTACGHKGSIPVSEIRKAVATTVRARRMTGCGLRRRWVVVGVRQIFCPGAGCNARFCPRCGGAEHTGTLCSPDTQDAKLMEWAAKKKKAVQACPQCYRLIEKGGGCKYMQCPTNLGGCGHEFCWLCREPYLGLHACGKPPADFEEVA